MTNGAARPIWSRMTGRFDHLPNRRAIIDRRAVADTIAALDETDPVALGRQATILLKAALDAGRVEVAKRLAEHPSRGLEVSSAQAYLIDQLLRLLFDFTTTRLHPAPAPTPDDRLTLIAVGGYGRGEMAPHSDVDIGFLTPGKQTPRVERIIESMLYTL